MVNLCWDQPHSFHICFHQSSHCVLKRTLFWVQTVCFFHQLLRGVTISNGGVLPRIHPELLSKKRGGRVKVDNQASVPDKQEERSKNKKPIKSFKKVKGKRGRKPKVSQLRMDRTHRDMGAIKASSCCRGNTCQIVKHSREPESELSETNNLIVNFTQWLVRLCRGENKQDPLDALKSSGQVETC